MKTMMANLLLWMGVAEVEHDIEVDESDARETRYLEARI